MKRPAKLHLLKPFIIVSLAFFYFLPIDAAVITKVKDKKVAIRLDGTSVSEGDILTAFQDGKKKAFIKVTKVKGGKALGEILRGHAEADMTLEPKGSSSSEHSSSSHHHTSRGSKGNLAAGLIAGMGLDSLSLTVSGISPSLSGSGIMVGLGVDYNLTKTFGLRGFVGLNNFSVTGTTNGVNLVATVNYIEAVGLVQYFLTEGTTRIWVGAGGGLFSGSSGSNNFQTALGIAIPQSTAGAIVAGAGLDWQITESLYIPFMVDYDYLLFSDSKWSIISLHAGLMYNF